MGLVRELAIVLLTLAVGEAGYVRTGDLHFYAGHVMGAHEIKYSYGPKVMQTQPVLRVAVSPKQRWFSVTVGYFTAGKGHADIQSPWFNWISE